MSRVSLRLWDPLVRLFHVSIAGVFVANYFFNEAGDDWHVWLGYYAVAWLAVRVVWGFLGPTSARWSDFWPSPARLRAHVRSLIDRKPVHRLGHSPLGALVMVLMMALIFGMGLTGFLMEEVDALWGPTGLCRPMKSSPIRCVLWWCCTWPQPSSKVFKCVTTCRCRC